MRTIHGSAPSTRASRQRGFTLVELIMTCVVMGIILAIGIPRLDSATFVADAEIRVVRYALQSAQRLSLEQQRDVIVSFDTVKNRVRVGLDRNNNAKIEGNEPYTWRPLEEGGKFAKPATGVNGSVSKSLAGSNIKTVQTYPSITLHRDGSSSSTFEAYLRVRAKNGSYKWRGVTLVQATARADWFVLTSTGWKKGGF